MFCYSTSPKQFQLINSDSWCLIFFPMEMGNRRLQQRHWQRSISCWFDRAYSSNFGNYLPQAKGATVPTTAATNAIAAKTWLGGKTIGVYIFLNHILEVIHFITDIIIRFLLILSVQNFNLQLKHNAHHDCPCWNQCRSRTQWCQPKAGRPSRRISAEKWISTQ